MKEEKLNSLLRHDGVNHVQKALSNLELAEGEIKEMGIVEGSKEKFKEAKNSVVEASKRLKKVGKEEGAKEGLREHIDSKRQNIEYLGEDFPEVGKYFRKAMNAIDSCEYLVEYVKKVEDTEAEELREVSLDPILQETKTEYEGMASRRGKDIVYENGEGYEVQAGDLLGEIFGNLIKNSIDHSDGDLIKIRTEQTDGEIRVTVEDNGQGVSDDEKEKISEKLQRWAQRGFRARSILR